MLLSFALIFILGLFGGLIFEKVKIPALFGMIIVGILLGPSVLNLIDGGVIEISALLRKIALIIILARAGFSLNISDLKRGGIASLLLCFLPASFEIIGCIILGPLLLGLTTLDSALLGAVLAAVSPAVVVPRMINLIGEDYGTKKSIPQMVLTGASVDDIYVIVIFTSLLSISLGGSFSIKTILSVPIAIFSGVIVGIIIGFLLLYVLTKVHLKDTLKVILLLSVSFILVTMEDKFSNVIPFASLIAIMATSGVIAKRDKKMAVRLSEKYNKMWSIAQILLFVLVGISTDVSYLKFAGLSSIVFIILALLFRFIGVFISLSTTNLNFREKFFTMGAYSPKATVQAAIGGIALEKGLSSGNIILTIAVLSILITAPIGAAFIDNTHKNLLTKDK